MRQPEDTLFFGLLTAEDLLRINALLVSVTKEACYPRSKT